MHAYPVPVVTHMYGWQRIIGPDLEYISSRGLFAYGKALAYFNLTKRLKVLYKPNRV